MSHDSFKAIQKYKKENAIKYGLIVSNPSKINAKYIFNTYFQTLSSNNYQIKRENHYEFTAQNCQNLTISIMIISNIDKIKEKYSTVNFFMLFIDMEDLNVINFLDKSLDTIISADDDFNKKCYILGFYAKDRKIVSNDRITNIIEAKGIDYYFTDIKNELRTGLEELIINAIEHGNLNISFEEKNTAILNGTFASLLEQRQVNELYKDKNITININNIHIFAIFI